MNYETSTERGVESEWKTIKETVVNTAQEVIGYRRGNKKEKWITDNTWRAIDERRGLKAKKSKLSEQAFKYRRSTIHTEIKVKN